MKRWAAISAFVLYLIEQGFAVAQGRDPIGVTGLALLLLLFTAMRATHSHNQLRNQPPPLPVATLP
jgi:hypothetical protein